MELVIWIGTIIQAIGLFSLAVALVMFRTKPYKQEYVLFGLSGVTIIFAGGLIQSVMGWFI